jgi:nucleoside 2-deoxyribosyltransferase
MRDSVSEIRRIGTHSGVNGLEQKRVYCSGPLFSSPEVAEMAEIATRLEAAGFITYLPQRDGLEALTINSVNAPLVNSRILLPVTRLLEEMIFAVDVFQILECDYLVLNMNGRVPDEGAAVEAGVAIATGLPVVIYNSDTRSESSRLTGILEMAAAGRVALIEEIPDALMKITGRCRVATGGSVYAEELNRLARKGRTAWRIISRVLALKARNQLSGT